MKLEIGKLYRAPWYMYDRWFSFEAEEVFMVTELHGQGIDPLSKLAYTKFSFLRADGQIIKKVRMYNKTIDCLERIEKKP